MLSKNEIKYIQSLKAKKQRREAGVFVVEGFKIISELLSNNTYEAVKVFGTQAFFEQTSETLLEGVACTVVTENELTVISFLQTPQQCLALVKVIDHAFEPFDRHQWSIMLDGIQDPGNLGTIIRIADWFGIKTIYASNDTVELYNPKVAQATMGSLFRVKVMYGPCEQWLKQYAPVCYVTAMDGENIWNIQSLAPGVVVIGNEGKGIGNAIASMSSGTIAIPRIGQAESLNAGVATGIILSHLLKPALKNNA